MAFTPTALYNLVSLSSLGTKGCISGSWSVTEITLAVDGGYIFGEALVRDGLYHLQIASNEGSLTLNYPRLVVAVMDFRDKV
jgi:hypothetical protein